jgi:hypothetical protein
LIKSGLTSKLIETDRQVILMAVKKTNKTEVQAEKAEKECCKNGKWIGLGWVLLLVGGLAHMLPEQMAPLLKWSLFGVSVQLAVGVVSVILALNFLLEE